MQALDEWNEKFGGPEEYSKSSKAGVFEFKHDKTYHVRIKSAKVSKSTRGDRQLTLGLAVLDGEGEEVGKTNQWVTLPKQPETDPQHDIEKVRKWTFRRRDDLAKILGNVAPGRFRLYDEVQVDGKNRTYLDKDGNVMSKADLDERQVEVNKQVMAFADELHEAISAGDEPDLSDFTNAEFYVVKVRNPKSDKYPYTNFYGDPSPKLPMWAGE